MILARIRPSVALLAVVLLGAFAPSLPAQTLIKEWRFATRHLDNLENHGWAGWGAKGESVIATTYTATKVAESNELPRLGVHKVAGSGGVRGVLFAHGGASRDASVRQDRFVAVTTFEPLVGKSLGYLVWEQATAEGNVASVRVLVRIAGKWFASREELPVPATSNAGEMTGTEARSFALSGPTGLGTVAWSEIVFGDDQPIQLRSAPVSAPIGDALEGIGFLIRVDGVRNTRVLFIDDVVILGSAP